MKAEKYKEKDGGYSWRCPECKGTIYHGLGNFDGWCKCKDKVWKPNWDERKTWLWETKEEKVKKENIEISVSCENTDCDNEYPQRMKRVKMKEEFEGDKAWWCGKCIERDGDMIEELDN